MEKKYESFLQLAELPNVIPLNLAVLCLNCAVVSDSPHEYCAACGEVGGLLPLARILNRDPSLGAISYIYAQADS